jgi:hypothetical protein
MRHATLQRSFDTLVGGDHERRMESSWRRCERAVTGGFTTLQMGIVEKLDYS